jgi:methylated-DNA-[protein]-cysteine S-methyltransferase
MNCVVLDTAAGPVTIESDGSRVCEIRLGKRGRGEPDAISREGARQLREYFAGKRRRFDFPTRLEAPEFTRSVLKRLERIPHGKSLTYGDVARSVGNGFLLDLEGIDYRD